MNQKRIKMKQSHPDIGEELDKIKTAHDQFIHQLKQIKTIPKEKYIQIDYLQNLKELAPWLVGSENNETNNFESESVNEGKEVIKQNVQKENLDELLEEIKSHPEQKATILQDFLNIFPELSDQDRLGILSNFNNLPLKKLRKELEDFIQLFQ
jgi:hypothetical protein